MRKAQFTEMLMAATAVVYQNVYEYKKHLYPYRACPGEAHPNLFHLNGGMEGYCLSCGKDPLSGRRLNGDLRFLLTPLSIIFFLQPIKSTSQEKRRKRFIFSI